MKKTLSLLIFSLSLLISANVFAQGKVHVIDMADQNRLIFAIGLSPDGTKVTGYDYGQAFSFVWTKEDGLKVLDEGVGASSAVAISNTGVVTGQFADTTLIYESPEYGPTALLSAGYFKEGKWHSLGLKEGVEPASMGGSLADAISADGTKIGGSRRAFTEEGREILEPVIWDIKNGKHSVQILEHEKTGQGARIEAMSANGKIAGGFAAPHDQRTPALWIDGKLRMIKMNGVIPNGEVLGISPNGRYAALSLAGNGGLYDIEQDRLVVIPPMEGMMSASATQVSDNGTVIGYNQFQIGPTNRVAFIFNEKFGTYSLTDYLAKLNIQIPQDLQMATSMGISADGKKIMGFGDQLINGMYFMVGWYIEIEKHLEGFNPVRDIVASEEGRSNIRISWEKPSTEGSSYMYEGYNLYRNGKKLNETLLTDTTYLDSSLSNGTYQYKVTAVYGDNQESLPTKVFKVSTAMVDLPFYDDFASANMDSLFWNTTSTNWSIDGFSGIQPPSIHYFNPIGGSYSESLTSPWINASYANDLFLSFNVVIPYAEVPGNDSLRVEVYDGEAWQTVARYGSSTWMSYSFEPKTIDISKVAAGKETRIRFTGYGDNSGEYAIWNIDNVNVYTSRQKFRVEKPLNLTAYRSDSAKVQLNWSDPNNVTTLTYLPYEEVYNCIGNEGKPFMAVSKFEKEDLKAFEGYYLTHISAYFNHNSWAGDPATYRLVVFKGDRQVVSQDITEFTPNAWNEIALKKTILVDPATPLYFGVEVVEHDPSDWPVGTCDGVLFDTWDDEQVVINDGKSNLYSEDGGKTWKKLTNDGMKHSIAVKATISKERPSAAKERLMGYRVYRDGYDLLGNDSSGNLLLTILNNFTDLSAPDYACSYTVTAFYTSQEESDMSEPAYISAVQEQPVTRASVSNETDLNIPVKIYSKQSDLYVITGQADVLSIYNINGQLHSQRSIPAGQTVISMPTGVYVIKVGNTTQKVVISQ